MKMKGLGAGFLDNLIREELDALIELRHHLHQIPELSFQEYQTSQLLQTFIQDIPGIDIQNGIATTGFVAVMGRGKPGKCIAFRADMDALPIKEKTGLPYASTHQGRMHACGHDGHSAILAGLVRVLARCQNFLNGPVKFIFQPAEEGGGGAGYMVEQGVLKFPDVHAIYGLHGWPTLDLGQVGSVEGPFFASTNAFDIVVEGKSGHAAFPHKTVDPIPVVAAIISSLQTLVSRNTNPLESCVLSICAVNGGTAYNVIPDHVSMKGTLRCFSQTHREAMLKKIETMSCSIAEAFGAKAHLKHREESYPVLNNDSGETDFFRQVAQQTLGGDALVPVEPLMGGEDFAYFANEVPGCFWLLGVKDPESESCPFLHTATYDFNDRALEIGIRLQAAIALEFQKR